MAVKLEQALGSTADTWLKMQMNYDLAQVRKRPIKVKRFAGA
jgi:addiction module HigA family antidote